MGATLEGRQMGLGLSGIVLILLGGAIWRFLRHRRYSAAGPLPDIGEAPQSAEPAMLWRYNDDGFTRFLDAAPEDVTSPPSSRAR